jgi:hypothetical protein
MVWRNGTLIKTVIVAVCNSAARCLLTQQQQLVVTPLAGYNLEVTASPLAIALIATDVTNRTVVWKGGFLLSSSLIEYIE